MGLMSRTLREEFKKSMDMCMYLLCGFYMLSNYSQFHPDLVQVKTDELLRKFTKHLVA